MNELKEIDQEIFITEISTPHILGAFIDSDLCDQIINHFEDPATIKNNSSPSYDGSVELERREGTECMFLDPLVHEYVRNLKCVLTLYLNRFPHVNELSNVFDLNDPIKIQKTEPPNGGFHQMHYESSSHDSSHRLLAFMTYLNDVDDGGETEFPNQYLRVKPKKGLTLIWPAGFDYIHRGLKSPTQTKYITTGWYTFTKKTNV